MSIKDKLLTKLELIQHYISSPNPNDMDRLKTLLMQVNELVESLPEEK